MRSDGMATAVPSGIENPCTSDRGIWCELPRTSFFRFLTSASSSCKRCGDDVSNPGDETVLRREEVFKLAEMLKHTSASEMMNETVMNVVALMLIWWLVAVFVILNLAAGNESVGSPGVWDPLRLSYWSLFVCCVSLSQSAIKHLKACVREEEGKKWSVEPMGY